MRYSIQWKPKPLKFLNKLSQDIALRIWNKLESIRENPFRYLEHYEGEGYKFRIGDYRVLVDVDIGRKIIFVQVLDKRGRIYKR